jgi:hypothetical protein
MQHIENPPVVSPKEVAGLDFLDFLFTVSMGIGLTPELLQLTFIKGLLQEGWALGEGRYPNTEEWLHIFSFILGFLTLTLSWYGYHGSLEKHPHKYDSGKDMARFVLDVVLVIFYGLMMVRFKNLTVVLVLLAIVFFVYSIWDAIKFYTPGFFDPAKPAENNEIKRRIYVTWKWATIVVGTLAVNLMFNWEWFCVMVAIVSVISYRLNKYTRFRDALKKAPLASDTADPVSSTG